MIWCDNFIDTGTLFIQKSFMFWNFVIWIRSWIYFLARDHILLVVSSLVLPPKDNKDIIVNAENLHHFVWLRILKAMSFRPFLATANLGSKRYDGLKVIIEFWLTNIPSFRSTSVEDYGYWTQVAIWKKWNVRHRFWLSTWERYEIKIKQLLLLMSKIETLYDLKITTSSFEKPSLATQCVTFTVFIFFKNMPTSKQKTEEDGSFQEHLFNLTKIDFTRGS